MNPEKTTMFFLGKIKYKMAREEETLLPRM